MNHYSNEHPAQPPLQNADRANLIEHSIRLVSDKYITTDDGFESRRLRIATDQYGEEYVAINQQPEKQRFVSLLMKPACRMADVVRVTDTFPDEGNFQYYSHVINLDAMEPGSQAEMLADMFMLDTVTSEYDHYPTPSMQYRGATLYKNTSIKGQISFQHYGFDYHVAFDPAIVFGMEATRDGIIEADLRKLYKLFSPNPTQQLPPPWLTETDIQTIRDIVRVGAAGALPLIKGKLEIMQQLYDGHMGYELFALQLAQANIDSDLTQIFDDKARQKWEDPAHQFHNYVCFRIQVAADLIESLLATN